MTLWTSDWARSVVDQETFRREQHRLTHVWTFLGLTQDVTRDGDWIRASIADRSVFVQRFGHELRGFENVCAHRFYPLRHEDKGNGPVVCGFHQWRYNRDGESIGIPMCTELYGKPPDQVRARLKCIEIETCGQLIFGRFAAPRATPSLKAYLGDVFVILEAMAQTNSKAHYTSREINANWKLNMHISLDDYHNPAVHPTTFGKGGYLHVSQCQYVRIGAHSAFLLTKDPTGFDKLLSGCRDGSFRSQHYFVLQVLPNLVISHVDADQPFWFVNIQQFSALEVDRTKFRSWSFPSPFDANFSWVARTTRPLTDLLRRPIYAYYYERVVREDITVCERLQRVAKQIDRPPLVGALEQRIAWFEESIRSLIDAD
jgi:phenylpropionate dioxygenase-like ring-hydroxylating dioxygenase large terminal subunit